MMMSGRLPTGDLIRPQNTALADLCFGLKLTAILFRIPNSAIDCFNSLIFGSMSSINSLVINKWYSLTRIGNSFSLCR